MEVKRLFLGNVGILVGFGFLFLFPVLFPQPYLLSLLISIFLYGVFAISYDLLLGFTGLISFGHALFFGIGAYTMGILLKETSLPFIIILILVSLMGVGMAFIKALFTLRVKGIYFAMVTLAFAQFFWVITQKWTSLTGGDDGMPRIPAPGFLSERIHLYYFSLLFLLLVYLFIRRVVNSPTGRVLIGIRENEERMAMLGFNVFYYRLFSLSLAGIVSGLAGGFYVIHINFAYPSLLDVQNTIDVLMMTIVGGVGTLHGPILGAVVVRLLSHFLSSHFRQWIILFGLIYISIVVFMPLGIFGGIRTIREWLKKQRHILPLGEKIE